MKRIILSIALAVMMGQAAYSQDINPQEEILAQVNESAAAELAAAQKTMDRATQMMAEAESSLAKVAQTRSEAAKQKKGKQKKLNKQADAMEQPILQKQVQAYKLMDEAYRKIYTTYYKDLADKYSTCPARKKETVEDLMNEYETNWDDALNTLKNVPADSKKADPKAATRVLKKGTDLQKNAVDAQISAYGEILGWYDAPEPAAAAQAQAQAAVETAPAKPADKIHYKVQIAADNSPLNLEFIKQYVYDTDEVINNEYTDGTYRYLVGRYNTYEEAMAAKERMNVKGAFIVKYKNGKRQVEITDEDEAN